MGWGVRFARSWDTREMRAALGSSLGLMLSLSCQPAVQVRPDVISSGDSSPVDAQASDSPPSFDASHCGTSAAAALDALTLDYRLWDGEAPPPVDIPWPVAPQCGTLSSTAPWLVLSGDGATRAARIDVASLASGLHRAALELRASDGSVFATKAATVRLFRAPRARTDRRVMVVGYDGARPDAVEAARTPVLDFLRRRAAQSFDARTQLTTQTVSAPGWMSTLTGVDPSRHRVEANGQYAARDGTHRTFVARAVDAGLRAVVATAWEEVITQIVEQSLPAAMVDRHFQLDPFAARWLAQRARTGSERLYFVHLNDPDAAGHSTGFSLDNPRYIEAIEGCDRNLGVLLDGVLSRPSVANEDWLFVLTTDHGGRGTTHGPLDDDNRRIWFVASGPSVTPEALGAGVSHMDTAPTVLQWLGVAIESAWALQGTARAR